MTQEVFNLVAAIGIIATFVVSLIGIIVSAAREKNTTYKTIITAERTKNNNIAKEYLAEVLELTYFLIFDNDANGIEELTPTKKTGIIRELLANNERYRKATILSRFYLNHDNEYYKNVCEISEKLEEILISLSKIELTIIESKMESKVGINQKDVDKAWKNKKKKLKELVDNKHTLAEHCELYFLEEQKIIENLAKKGKSK